MKPEVTLAFKSERTVLNNGEDVLCKRSDASQNCQDLKRTVTNAFKVVYFSFPIRCSYCLRSRRCQSLFGRIRNTRSLLPLWGRYPWGFYPRICRRSLVVLICFNLRHFSPLLQRIPLTLHSHLPTQYQFKHELNLGKVVNKLDIYLGRNPLSILSIFKNHKRGFGSSIFGNNDPGANTAILRSKR